MTPDPSSTSLLEKERERAERRLASARVLILGAGAAVLAPLTALATGSDRPVQARALAIVLLAVAWAWVWRRWVRSRPVVAAHRWFSSSVDLLLVVALVINWSIYDGTLLPTQARFAVGYGALFALICLTAVRFDWRTVLLATLEAAFFYAAYVVVSVHTSQTPVFFGTEATLRGNGLNAVDQIGRVAMLLFSGLLLSYLMFRAGLLLERSVRTAEQKGRLRQFITAQVVDDIESGKANLDLSGQCKRITILFADIRGFTTLSETLGPVQLLDLLNAFYELTAEEIFRHRGTVDKYMGDGLMALFGAPQELENCSREAVRCALAMLEKVGEFNRLYGRAIEIGIGLHTGEVAVGNLGTRTFKSYTAVGESVNLASRIESATRSCDARLLFSSEVARDLSGFLPVRPMGEFALKGVSQPLPLFTVADGRAAPSATG